VSAARARRRGLVLSGGAALGAYQAGALKTLRQRGLEFELISATSIGTLHALAWNMGDFVLELDEHWRRHVAGLRPFDLRRLLRGQSPIQFSASLDVVFDSHRDDYPHEDAPVEILVTLGELESGQARVFSTRDESFSLEERELFHKASTALPHLGVPPIEIKGRHYYDGGYFDSCPVKPLCGRGLDEIWLIPLAPLRRGRGGAARRPLHERVRQSYLAPLVGLLDQRGRRPDLEADVPAVVIAPASYAEAKKIFRASHALTFSLENIERLLEQGGRDAERVCDERAV